MDTNTMFEQASRLKVRFETPRGMLSTEDLWDLPLTSATGRPNLDAIALGLYRQTKEAGDVASFVAPTTKNAKSGELLLAFEIVKHVIAVRVRERDEKTAAAERSAKKQRILELIARKQDEALAGKSEDELRALAESL